MTNIDCKEIAKMIFHIQKDFPADMDYFFNFIQLYLDNEGREYIKSISEMIFSEILNNFFAFKNRQLKTTLTKITILIRQI